MTTKQEAKEKCDELHSQLDKLEDQIIAICNEFGISYVIRALNTANEYVGRGAPGSLCGECEGDWKATEKYGACEYCTEGYRTDGHEGWQTSYC